MVEALFRLQGSGGQAWEMFVKTPLEQPPDTQPPNKVK